MLLGLKIYYQQPILQEDIISAKHAVEDKYKTIYSHAIPLNGLDNPLIHRLCALEVHLLFFHPWEQVPFTSTDIVSQQAGEGADNNAIEYARRIAGTVEWPTENIWKMAEGTDAIKWAGLSDSGGNAGDFFMDQVDSGAVTVLEAMSLLLRGFLSSAAVGTN